MLLIAKHGGDKDHSSNLSTIWRQNPCFHIIFQCIQAINPPRYDPGPLLTLVLWLLSWSDIFSNIDRNKFLTLFSFVWQCPWKKIKANAKQDCLYSCIFSLHVLDDTTNTPLFLLLLPVDAYGGCSCLRDIAWSFIISYRLSNQTMNILLKIDDYIEVHMSKKAFI